MVDRDGKIRRLQVSTHSHLGDFVAIANPNDIMPEVGAFRAHHSNETWQTAIVEWVRAAQLIVQVAGPTSWLRWELETILAASAGPKLILIFPPGPPMSS